MWQTKYASAVPKNLGLGFDFWPCSEGNFFTGRPGSPWFGQKQTAAWKLCELWIVFDQSFPHEN